jgi:hypothetical protein
VAQAEVEEEAARQRYRSATTLAAERAATTE